MTAKESGPDQKSEVPDEKIQEKGHVPMQRAGADEEMAMGKLPLLMCKLDRTDMTLAVLFLAKNTYVNGEILAVDGGVLNVVAGR